MILLISPTIRVDSAGIPLVPNSSKWFVTKPLIHGNIPRGITARLTCVLIQNGLALFMSLRCVLKTWKKYCQAIMIWSCLHQAPAAALGVAHAAFSVRTWCKTDSFLPYTVDGTGQSNVRKSASHLYWMGKSPAIINGVAQFVIVPYG